MLFDIVNRYAIGNGQLIDPYHLQLGSRASFSLQIFLLMSAVYSMVQNQAAVRPQIPSIERLIANRRKWTPIQTKRRTKKRDVA